MILFLCEISKLEGSLCVPRQTAADGFAVNLLKDLTAEFAKKAPSSLSEVLNLQNKSLLNS